MYLKQFETHFNVCIFYARSKEFHEKLQIYSNKGRKQVYVKEIVLQLIF